MCPYKLYRRETGLDLKGAYQLSVYADKVNLSSVNISEVKITAVTQ
jgi:hypothetical protein